MSDVRASLRCGAHVTPLGGKDLLEQDAQGENDGEDTQLGPGVQSKGLEQGRGDLEVQPRYRASRDQVACALDSR